ncbi:bacteriocin-processing peptidase. Cysteine peptidase. MEROPS family C39 [Chitinophaga costaii]|uniref:Bacteriocin-processing peptidase. Cysteine peptidase. MEROPS family C39 n=2 Tax=Chitinophaga costaii TaxID=1335309 RepID=A0A1C4AWV9_9BACT|nr:peptidase domain-containing ABC transporter [Chitinophaga costaii]SCB99140.1 bacteriocin-processing peptidase. Cysteine peptidase. MEROPS family C39 [Chitinophaga costaii]
MKLPLTSRWKSSRRLLARQHDLTDCGAACLSSIAAYYHLQMPLARIRQYAGTDKKGTSLLGLLDAANRLGFKGKAIRGPYECLKEIPLPAVAHVIINQTLHHYVVLYAVKVNGVQVMDPADGQMHTYTPEAFQKIWTGVLLLLTPGEAFTEGNEKVPVAARFWYLLRPHGSTLLQVMFGAIVYTALGLSTSIFLQKIIDHVLPDRNGNLLNLMGIIMVALLVVGLCINHMRTVLTIKTGQQIDARLILGYYKHLLRLPQQFFDNMRVGEIISRMNDAVKIRVFLNEVMVSFAVNIFILFFSFALMFTYYWKLALMLIAIVPLYGLIYYFSNKVNKHTQRKLMEESADLQAQFVESVQSVGTIKRFGVEEYANLKTETRFIRVLKTIYRTSQNGLWIGNSSSFVTGAFTILLLWVGAGFVIQNLLTPGELLSFYSLIGYFTGPVAGLIGMNKTMQDALIAADRLFEIMDLERESMENKTALTPDMIGDIRFKDVFFRYGSRVNVFEGFNLHIPRGRITALVGESGSGKTTLLSLLQNIYPLQAGNVMIGEFDIRYLTTDSLRRYVSVVPQQVDLFAGNVIENIALGDFEPDVKKIVRICHDIQILDFIERLPQGFNTPLGEHGATLSGGQRQRIAIARALYKEPEVLILDEATAALDSQSELHIQHAIQQLRAADKTIVLIAHRLSTVIHADKIVVMSQGKVLEEGGHDALLQRQGAYYQMWEAQFPMISKMLKKPRIKRELPESEENIDKV